MRKYASPKDRQPEVRTKVPEEVYDILEAFARRAKLTDYEAARIALLSGLLELSKAVSLRDNVPPPSPPGGCAPPAVQ